MAEAGTLHDAFIDELRDTYDAEKQLTKALAQVGESRVEPQAAVRRSRAIFKRHRADRTAGEGVREPGRKGARQAL